VEPGIVKKLKKKHIDALLNRYILMFPIKKATNNLPYNEPEEEINVIYVSMVG